MKLVQLTVEQYEQYAQTHTLPFLQSAQYLHFCQLRQRPFYVLGIMDQGKIVTAALFLIQPFLKVFKKAYLNTYPWNNSKVDKEFLRQACQFLKKNKVVIFEFTTTLARNLRDQEGEVLETTAQQNARHQYFVNQGFVEASELDDVTSYSWQYVKSLEDYQSEEELLSSVSIKYRTKIRKTLKNGLVFKQLNSDELETVRDIYNCSATRQGFVKHDLAYFKNFDEAFKGSERLFFLACYLDTDKHLAIKQADVERAQEQLDKLLLKKQQRGSDVFDQKIVALEKELNAAQSLLMEAQKYCQAGDKIYLSAGLFFADEEELIHFIGGNDETYAQLRGSYFLQHHAMLLALKLNKKQYNFFGTVGPYIKNTNENMYGVYAFKKGFNGNVVQLDNYTKVLNKPAYCINRLLSKLRK